MKWQKLGKIFDPTEHQLTHNCIDFAQAPQTLIFDDFIRIYFSTREKDVNGKFLSHISYVEMDKTFQKVLNISKHTIIPLGKLGCYDEHGIFPLNILRDEKRILGFIGGISRRISVCVEASIGLAISNDNGLTFRRIGDGPVLTASLNEPFLIADPFVLKLDAIYYMWYIFGQKWSDNNETGLSERVYKIGYATSDDGINWTKANKKIIPDVIDENECQAMPTIIKLGNRYRMYFCYRHMTGFREDKNKGYRLGYAYSDDLVNWTRDDENSGITTSEEGWDSDMMCYPHVFEMDGEVYLLYNGNDFGRYGFGLARLERE